jgi:hypothetical protein
VRQSGARGGHLASAARVAHRSSPDPNQSQSAVEPVSVRNSRRETVLQRRRRRRGLGPRPPVPSGRDEDLARILRQSAGN